MLQKVAAAASGLRSVSDQGNINISRTLLVGTRISAWRYIHVRTPFQELTGVCTSPDAPLAEERYRHIQHCIERGSTHSTVGLKCRELLWAAHLMEAERRSSFENEFLHALARHPPGLVLSLGEVRRNHQESPKFLRAINYAPHGLQADPMVVDNHSTRRRTRGRALAQPSPPLHMHFTLPAPGNYGGVPLRDPAENQLRPGVCRNPSLDRDSHRHSSEQARS